MLETQRHILDSPLLKTGDISRSSIHPWYILFGSSFKPNIYKSSRDMKTLQLKPSQQMGLAAFREMDYFAVETLGLDIQLMMENAGLQLARLVARSAKPSDSIVVGVGNGNNGGGGLVAARRLAGWGLNVSLDICGNIDRDLPVKQLERAIAFGVNTMPSQDPQIWVDAYLGFSQRLPLNKAFLKSVIQANESGAFRISLDIPTGISPDLSAPHFDARQVLCLAAPKEILRRLNPEVEIFLADLGLPHEVYSKYGIEQPPFFSDQMIRIEYVNE